MPPPRISRVASLFELVSPTSVSRSTSRQPSGLMRHRCRRHVRRTPAAARAPTSPRVAAEQLLRRRFRLAHRLVAVHQPRHFARQLALRVPLLGLARARRLELGDRAPLEEREELQVPHRVAIVGVEPELIELVRRRQLPDRARSCPPRSCRTSFPPPSSPAAAPGRAPCAPRTRRIRSMPAVMLPH